MLTEIADARYEIVKILGQGSSADVYLAKHQALNELRVLKILHQSMMLDKKRKAKFQLEAQLAANLKHPAIVHIYDVTQTDSKLQIEMEFIDGLSLRQHLEKRHSFPLPVALAIIYAVLEGLEHAHNAKLEFDGVEYDGVIHRDLKPENILIRKLGQPVICDFGIAKLGADLLSQTQNISGSVAYMAPERLRGELSTRSIDIFAIGVIFFELYKGHRPFQGNNRTTVIENILKWNIANIEEELKDSDPAVREVLQKALAKNPAQRYQNASEMLNAVHAIYRLYHGEVTPAQVVGGFLTRGQFGTAEFKALLPETTSWKSKTTFFVLMALGLGLVIFLLLHSTTSIPKMASSKDLQGIDALLEEHKIEDAKNLINTLPIPLQQEAYFRVGKAYWESSKDAGNALLLINKALNIAFHPTIAALRVEIYLNQDMLNMAQGDLVQIEPWLNKMNPENQARYYLLLGQLYMQEDRKLNAQTTPSHKIQARAAFQKYLELPSGQQDNDQQMVKSWLKSL